MHAKASGLLGLFLWSGAVLILVLAALLFVITGIVTNPVRRVAKNLQELSSAGGDLTVRLRAQGNDETRDLVEGFNEFIGKIAGVIATIQASSEKLVAMGSTLSASAEESAAAIEEMSATTSQVSRFSELQKTQTRESSEAVAAIAKSIHQSGELAQGMAAQFFMFSQSMELNRRGVTEAREESKATDALALALYATGEAGQKLLDELRDSISKVVESAQQIQTIVQYISGIAGQTSILSMNAAIEAAHAGTYGKGFAIVADEIRKLAETSTAQAEAIEKLLVAISTSADHTLAKSNETLGRFEELMRDIVSVRESSQRILGQMNQQETEDAKLSEGLFEFTRFYERLSAVVEEQAVRSQGVTEKLLALNNGSLQISQSMAEQKIGMDQAAETVVQVRETSVELTDIIQQLSEKTGQFKI